MIMIKFEIIILKCCICNYIFESEQMGVFFVKIFLQYIDIIII